MKIRLLTLLLGVFSTIFLVAQNPVKWSYSSKDAGNGQFDLVFTGTIDDGWYTYSQFLESEDGPVASSFTFDLKPHFKLVGKAVESGEIIKVYDKVFGMNLTKFKHKAVFTQRVQVSDFSKPIEGYFTYMTCNDEMCLPPKDVDFKFSLTAPSGGNGAAPNQNSPVSPSQNANPKDAKNGGTGAMTPAPGNISPNIDEKKTVEAPAVLDAINPIPTQPGATQPAENQPTTPGFVNPPPPDDPRFQGFYDAKRDINSAQFVNQCGVVEAADPTWWWVFFGGFLGGLLALLTPCVFPMIPMTVTFFVKRSKDRASGLKNAIWYGASIIIIYVGIGLILTSLFGATILNDLSTNPWFNVAFFLIFLVFALSFFGLFEITLPEKWVTGSDRMADKGGLMGIFFMAFTLALVSFSCTGPIVGTLLVETAKSNAGTALFGFIPVRPLIGMFGFSLALALPFGLFAAFPGWLQSLPKSGGWMDNVKISLGLLEVALALKFLSTADMVMHWGILKFEIFLALWLLVAVVLGLYQLGIFKWKGATGKLTPARLAIGLGSLVFAAYMANGLFNYKSLSVLSGIAPPVHYNYFRPMECPHGLDCFHNFDDGLAEAKRLGKPLFVDFTGYGCVNCRKMEENVWHLPGVFEHLKNDYVVVSLYVDDKERLFPDDKFKYLLDPRTGDKMRTVGDKWSAFQVNNFAVTAQPYYVLMSNDGKTLLNQPTDYNGGKDPKAYQAFLDCGLDAFKKVQNGGGDLLGKK